MCLAFCDEVIIYGFIKEYMNVLMKCNKILGCDFEWIEESLADGGGAGHLRRYLEKEGRKRTPGPVLESERARAAADCRI